jgi:hypothetical protein
LHAFSCKGFLNRSHVKMVKIKLRFVKIKLRFVKIKLRFVKIKLRFLGAPLSYSFSAVKEKRCFFKSS